MADRTWLASPLSSVFDSGPNWEGGAAAPAPGDNAIFAASSITDLTFSGGTSVAAWTFMASAPVYSFTIAAGNFVSLSGAGIVNGGDVTIINNNALNFTNGSSAGGATIANGVLGIVSFLDDSSAGNSVITNNNALYFNENSSAGSASITNNDNLNFTGTSKGGTSAIINNDTLNFHDQSTAETATLTTNNGATTLFTGNSTGGAARFIANAGGTVEFAGVGPNSDNVMSAGSIEGGGTYDLDFTDLVVGSNNLSTVVSGLITGFGELIKVGAGKLTLSNTNTYSGATNINGGVLQVDGALTQFGVVTVNSGGTLAGSGSTGASRFVKVNLGGTLSPGASAGTLSTASVEFVAGAAFKVELGGVAAGSGHDQLNAAGSVKLGGATLQASLINGFTPGSAESFVIIANDGSDAVNGTFAGLAEGSQFALGGHLLTITYHGGTGNDVVLTSGGAAGGALINGTEAADTINTTTAPAGQPTATAFSDTINARGGDDVVDAGGGADRVNGGAGKDSLAGGLGPDIFVFDAAIKPMKAAKANADTIVDFNPAEDTIELAKAVFKKLDLGVPSNKDFGSGNKKPENDKHLVYFDARKDALWYDANGAKEKGKGDILIAQFSNNPDLAANDLIVV